MIEFKKLDDNVDYKDKNQCNPMDWDVICINNNWREFIITDSEVPGFVKDQEVMEFMDHVVPMRVYKVHGYFHTEYGNGGGNDYYICRRDEKPSKETLEEYDYKDWTPWGIVVKPKTYWHKDEMRSGISVAITRNGKEFDTIGARKMSYGLVEAQHMIHKLEEPNVPIYFNDIDFDKKIIGRVCEWRGVRVKVERYIWGQNSVILKPINVADIDKIDDTEDPTAKEDWVSIGIKDHVFSPFINWWPKENPYEEDASPTASIPPSNSVISKS